MFVTEFSEMAKATTMKSSDILGHGKLYVLSLFGRSCDLDGHVTNEYVVSYKPSHMWKTTQHSILKSLMQGLQVCQTSAPS